MTTTAQEGTTMTLAQMIYAANPNAVEWNPRLRLWCWTGNYQPLRRRELEELQLDPAGPQA